MTAKAIQIGDWAVVIGGGGKKGAFSAGVVYALRVKYKMEFSHVSGTSTGALQAGPVLLDDLELLNDLYRNVEDRHVLERHGVIEAILKRGLSGVGPLKRLIATYSDFPALADAWPEKVMMVSCVNLRSGEVHRWTNSPDHIHRLPEYILASACMPVLMTPQVIDGDIMVDGGLIDTVPVGAILESSWPTLPRGLVVIQNSPPRQTKQKKNPDDIVEILIRTIDILSSQIAIDDMRIAKLINRVRDLQDDGNPVEIDYPDPSPQIKGGWDRAVPIIDIHPETDYGDPLDFDPVAMTKIWQDGVDAACRVMDKYLEETTV